MISEVDVIGLSVILEQLLSLVEVPSYITNDK